MSLNGDKMFEKEDEKLELVKKMIGTRDSYMELVKDIYLTEDEETVLMRAFSQIKKENPNFIIIEKAYTILIDKAIKEEKKDTYKKQPSKNIANTSKKGFDATKKNNHKYVLIFLLVIGSYFFINSFFDKEHSKTSIKTSKYNVAEENIKKWNDKKNLSSLFSLRGHCLVSGLEAIGYFIEQGVVSKNFYFTGNQEQDTLSCCSNIMASKYSVEKYKDIESYPNGYQLIQKNCLRASIQCIKKNIFWNEN